MKKITIGMLFILFLTFFSCSHKLVRPMPLKHHQRSKVVLGVENFLQNYKTLVKGKRVGLLTNPSGVDSKLRSTADLFAADPDINLTALFGPEHGIRGAIYAGEKVSDEVDPHTGVQVFSLYGKHRKPTKAMMDKVDVVFVDIQDIGLRAYTYIYTMAKVMEAAAEFDKEVIILDRPDPIGGEKIEGNLVEPQFESFVGMFPIPYRYAMTIGELAKLFNNEFNIHCRLKVIPMVGWQRNMLWKDTGLLWVPTSPHVPHWETVLYMGATGTFGELHVLSEGVGYTSPFEIVGAPWVDGYQFARALNDLHLPGVIFRPLYFKPYYAHYKGQVCQGVQLHITDPYIFDSYSTGLYIMQTSMKLYPDHNLFGQPDRVSMFNKVMGCDWITKDLQQGVPVEKIIQKWQPDIEKFKEMRKKYLIY